MSEFFYVLKIGLATVVFIILMQTNWDNKPIENHLTTWIKTSSLVMPIRDFAQRGAVMVRKTYKDTTAFIDSKLKSSDYESKRKSLFNFKRSASAEEKRKDREDSERWETDKSEASF